MNVKDIIVVAVIILALDAVFLTLAKDFFARQVMLVQGTAMKVNIPSAAVCYLLIVLGLYYFVLRTSSFQMRPVPPRRSKRCVSVME